MNILEEIIEYKKGEVKKLKQRYSTGSFTEMEFFGNTALNLQDFIQPHSMGIIAEIKKASPSKGIIRNDFNHLKIAEVYFKEDVSAVSVLTDENFFKGKIEYLKDIAKIKQRPLLRKDFIFDEHQVYEAKAYGADIILLISEVLSKSQIEELTCASKEIGMDVLLELHSKEQLLKINFELNNIIGINNRNLKDFSVSLETTKNIGSEIPDNVLIVSESGISKKEDIDFLKTTKAKLILVGEHLMASKDIKGKLEQLKEWCIINQRFTR
jgi:indole-3-glycerol phosphate synthase